jgi:MFS family permease
MRTFLVLAAAFGSMGLAAGGTAGALVAAELTGGTASAGLPLGAVVAGSAAGALLISRVTRRAGRIAALVLGYLIGGLGAALVLVAATAASLGLVIAGSVVMGVANAAVYLTRYAAADAVPEAERGRALGAVLGGAAVGAVAGPNLLGISGDLAAGLGLPRFSGLYLVAAAAFPVAGALLALCGLHNRGGTGAGSSPVPGRPAGAAVAVLAITNLVMVAVMAIAPLHMLAHGHDLELIGVVVSIHVVCMLAPAPVAGWLADRTSPAVLAGLAAILLAAAGVLGAVADPHSDVAFTVVLAVLGLGWCAGVVAGSILLMASVPEPARPRAEGIGEFAMGVAAGGGAPLAGLLLALGGFQTLALALAVVSVVILPWAGTTLSGSGGPTTSPAPAARSAASSRLTTERE